MIREASSFTPIQKVSMFRSNTNGMTVKKLKSIEITLGHSRNISKRFGAYLASPG